MVYHHALKERHEGIRLMRRNIKKIGCVIAYGHGQNNYGTSLQGYATVKKISDLGCDFEILRYRKQLSLFRKIYLVFQMFRCGGFFSKSRVVKEKINKVLHKQYSKNISIRTSAVNRFKKKKLIPHFREYNSLDDLHNNSSNYEVILVGSDQVWTPMGLYSRYYNLLFVKDEVCKVSYASSFGVSSIPKFQKKQTKEYLDRFEKIGVRESTGKNIVESLTEKQAIVVLDPTMLLTREEWMEEIRDAKITEKPPYIFCCFLGKNKAHRDAVRTLSEKTSLRVVDIKHMDEYIQDDEEFADSSPYNVSPDDFIKYIQNADYVCTDSFHCAIFSIIFHKKFMVFYRFPVNSKISRNSRIDNLLELFGLQNRLFKGDNIGEIFSEIDYEIVTNRLDELRKESINFLQSALERNDI